MLKNFVSLQYFGVGIFRQWQSNLLVTKNFMDLNSSTYIACKRLAGFIPALLLCFFACSSALAAEKEPNENWTRQSTTVDASGSSSQNLAPYFDYAFDLYENMNYNSDGAAAAEFFSVSSAVDKNFIYVDVEFAEDWSTASNRAMLTGEIDTNEDFRSNHFVIVLVRDAFDIAGRWVEPEENGIDFVIRKYIKC